MRSNSDEVEKNNDCLRVYTSPPPTAEPLLKEKPLKVASNLMCRNNCIRIYKRGDEGVKNKKHFYPILNITGWFVFIIGFVLFISQKPLNYGWLVIALIAEESRTPYAPTC